MFKLYLKVLLPVFLLLTVMSVPAYAAERFDQFSAQSRSLKFYNTHTKESLEITYYAKGRYDEQALDQISYFLRDHRTGHVHDIDAKLMDLL
jgi:uncharacterized protein YcbK (DUF882 family)